MKTFLRRVAILLALACIFSTLGSAPASAAVVDTEITGGSVMVGPTTIGLTGTGSCGAGTIQADITSSSVVVTALDTASVVDFGGTDYIIELSMLYSNPGDVTGSSPATIGATTPLDLAIHADISVLVAPPCTAGTPVCHVAVGMFLTGSFTGNPGALTPGDSFTLGGADYTGGVQANPTCAAPFATYLGQSMVATGVTGTI